MDRAELLKIAKPILFNTEMVQAILEGRKTVTRRVVKPQPEGYFEVNDNPLYIYDSDLPPGRISPQFQAGDLLYVRETWCWCPCWDCGNDTEEGCCDKTAEKFYHPKRHEYGCYGYRASFKENEEPFDRWYPSIHMPKEAARIFLKVTDVRVERLQDITEEQVLAEGIYPSNCRKCTGKMGCDLCPDEGYYEIDAFQYLWNSTIKKQDLDKYGWDASPWVWVIEFERVEV